MANSKVFFEALRCRTSLYCLNQYTFDCPFFSSEQISTKTWLCKTMSLFLKPKVTCCSHREKEDDTVAMYLKVIWMLLPTSLGKKITEIHGATLKWPIGCPPTLLYLLVARVQGRPSVKNYNPDPFQEITWVWRPAALTISFEDYRICTGCITVGHMRMLQVP